MPNEYQYTAVSPDGRRVGWDGSKWVPIPSTPSRTSLWEAANKPLGRDVATRTREAISDLTSRLPESVRGPAAFVGNVITAVPTSVVEAGRRMATSPLGAGTLALGGLMQELRELATVPKAVKTAVGIGETGVGGAFGAFGAEEALKKGPKGETGLQEFERRVGGAGQALMGGAAMTHAAAELPEKAHGMLQQAIVGRAEVERARVAHEAEVKAANEAYEKKVAEVGRKTAADEAAHKLAIEQSKDKYANAVAEYTRKAREASARESAAEVKKRTFVQPRSGPVYQRLAGMADSVADGIGKLDRSVRTAYDARWGAWREAMGPGTEADFTPVMEAVANAEDTILKGSPENITVFRNILAEAEDPILSQASVFRGRGAGVDIKEVMRGMSGPARDRLVRSLEEQGAEVGTGRLPIEPTSLPIDDIRGYVTELQQKRFTGRFTGDVYRAIKHVEEAANGVVEDVAKEQGQLSVYRQLKADWSQYLSDFYDSDGSLTKLKGATNADSRLNLLSGSEGANIVEALGRYARLDPTVGQAAIDITGRVRSMMKQLREMPSSAKVPGPPERPTFPPPKQPRPMPERPGIRQFSPEEFRRGQIQRTAENLSRITGWDVASIGYALRELFTGEVPWALGYPVGKRLLSRMLSIPGVVDYLAREGMPQAPPSRTPPPGWRGGINPRGVEQSLRPHTPGDLAQALRVETADLRQRIGSTPPGPERDRLYERIAENMELIQAFEGGR